MELATRTGKHGTRHHKVQTEKPVTDARKESGQAATELIKHLILNMITGTTQQQFGTTWGRILGVLLLLCLGASFAALADERKNSDAEPHENIRNSALQFLQATLATEEFTDLEVSIGQLDPRLRLERCATELEPFVSQHTRLMGTAQVGIRCHTPKPWTIYISARINLYQQIVTAKRPLMRGTTLSADDLMLARNEISSLYGRYLTEPEQVIGKVLRQDLNQGSVITLPQLKNPVLIHRGQKVTLLAEMDGIEVRMTGTAMQNAVSGDLIKVKNLTSQRIIEGIVLNNKTIKVSL